MSLSTWFFFSPIGLRDYGFATVRFNRVEHFSAVCLSAKIIYYNLCAFLGQFYGNAFPISLVAPVTMAIYPIRFIYVVYELKSSHKEPLVLLSLFISKIGNLSTA